GDDVLEGNKALPHVSKMVADIAGTRKRDGAGAQKLDALVAEPEHVHRVLPVDDAAGHHSDAPGAPAFADDALPLLLHVAQEGTAGPLRGEPCTVRPQLVTDRRRDDQ